MAEKKRIPKGYRDICGNCQAELLKGALYCDLCGTKRGEGEFKPIKNISRFVYAPPIKIIQHCSACSYKWLKVGLGIKKSSYCPKCQSPSIRTLEKKHWFHGETFGDFLEKNEPLQLFTEDEVKNILSLREELKKIKTDEDDYYVILRFMKQNGFEEHAKKLAHKDLSNREAERINLSRKILKLLGAENAFSKGRICPKCNGTIACIVKKFKEKRNSNEEIIPKGIKTFTLSKQHARWYSDDDNLMCLQCGHQFKKARKACCKNCGAVLPKEAASCNQCGSKKGEGKFKPSRNRVCCIYGPPITIVQHCSACDFKWKKYGMSIRESTRCPNCKSPSIEVLKRDPPKRTRKTLTKKTDK